MKSKTPRCTWLCWKPALIYLNTCTFTHNLSFMSVIETHDEFDISVCLDKLQHFTKRHNDARNDICCKIFLYNAMHCYKAGLSVLAFEKRSEFKIEQNGNNACLFYYDILCIVCTDRRFELVSNVEKRPLFT